MSGIYDWFANNSDRTSATDGSALMSIGALAHSLTCFVGRDLPTPVDRTTRQAWGPHYVETALTELFRDRLQMDVPCRPVANVTKRFKGQSVNKAEAFEFVWMIVSKCIDARFTSMLPRTGNARATRLALHSRVAFRAVECKGWPETDAEWERAARFIAAALPCVDALDALTPTTIDDVVREIADMCSHAIGVPVGEDLLHAHVGPLCLHIEPSRFLAKTILRSCIVGEILGSGLALIVRRRQFENDWCCVLECEDVSPMSIALRELVQTRAQFVELKAAISSGCFDRARELCGPSLIVTSARPKLKTLLEDKRALKFEELFRRSELLLSSNMTCSALRKTIGYITELAKDTPNEQMHAELELITKSSREIRQFIMHLEEAVESTDREWFNQALDFGCSLGLIVRRTACTHVYHVYRCMCMRIYTYRYTWFRMCLFEDAFNRSRDFLFSRKSFNARSRASNITNAQVKHPKTQFSKKNSEAQSQHDNETEQHIKRNLGSHGSYARPPRN